MVGKGQALEWPPEAHGTWLGGRGQGQEWAEVRPAPFRAPSQGGPAF